MKSVFYGTILILLFLTVSTCEYNTIKEYEKMREERAKQIEGVTNEY